MADLVQEIRESDGSGKKSNAARKVARRKGFEKVQIYMPVVNYVEGDTVRPSTMNKTF